MRPQRCIKLNISKLILQFMKLKVFTSSSGVLLTCLPVCCYPLEHKHKSGQCLSRCVEIMELKQYIKPCPKDLRFYSFTGTKEKSFSRLLPLTLKVQSPGEFHMRAVLEAPTCQYFINTRATLSGKVAKTHYIRNHSQLSYTL